MVVSDWSATYSTVPSARAGLDLVMPGPDRPVGRQLSSPAVAAAAVLEAAIDDKVSRLLALARRVGALNGAGQRDGVDGHHVDSDGQR